MKINMRQFALLIFYISLFSCGKDDDNSSPTQLVTDVYIAGAELNGAGFVAKYWKNGVEAILTDGTNDAYANSIFVEGNDVYVAGSEYEGIINQAKVWKNGIETALIPSSVSSATSIFVDGIDIYVGGFSITSLGKPEAVIYKNGTQLVIQNNGKPSVINAIYVSEENVYGAGYTTPSSSNVRQSKLWKNEEGSLTNGIGTAYSVFVSENDIYVASTELIIATNVATATLWKNGISTPLSANGENTRANAVFVSKENTYVVGLEFINHSVAKIWKNGIESSLTASTEFSSANSVYVLDEDVYVVGYKINTATTNEVATLWKNGLEMPLTNGSQVSIAKSVFVTKN